MELIDVPDKELIKHLEANGYTVEAVKGMLDDVYYKSETDKVAHLLKP